VSSSRVAEKPVYCTDSAVRAATSSETIGPLLRRGTMYVAGGSPALGGTGTTTSLAPSCRALTRYVSGTATTCSSAPSYTVDSPLGEVASGWIRSMYVSVTSIGLVVAPQAMCRFWPRMTNGVPAKPSPCTSIPPPRRAIG
jgi:hypothetical protein